MGTVARFGVHAPSTWGEKKPSFCSSNSNKISQFITVSYSGGNIFKPFSPLIRLRKRLLHDKSSPTFTTFSQLNFQQSELEADKLSVVAVHESEA